MLSKKSSGRAVGAWLLLGSGKWRADGVFSSLAQRGRRPRRSRYQPTPRNSRVGRLWWRPDEVEGQRLEVLHDGGEMELVSGARQAAQPHALEAVMGLQVCEAHLDAFA